MRRRRMRRKPVRLRVGETADEKNVAEGVIHDKASNPAKRMLTGTVRRVANNARVNDNQVYLLRRREPDNFALWVAPPLHRRVRDAVLRQPAIRHGKDRLGAPVRGRFHPP